ncbi:hypothetical protein WISP_01550 [Willisornis vidua]|uniref:Uncharacterized protein n=1 Tax=Willisornis vidua TaxID=1566151 RepID=A0ABQ9DV35_9PASS|nr:hypothetical protein WISP_01550 [Willisornis vidua]
MKVTVLSVALLFTILLSPQAEAMDPIEISGGGCAGNAIIRGVDGQGRIKISRVKRSESPVTDQVELLRE